ncbi:hypothetical protein [Pseudoalteromonas luteoviolacea]|uniref:Lantibiotic n=1 Tax=Pseudoalteromonas luteoviolacea DSM 6061 TaxID=1365250 RepID=A0A166WLV5_9GAMM|nr:hypothetical protein [Pseudoalteromonas luteoviolacea]KZN37634.1 hypothetical protein N475_02160 [Pseudoalteromonas luteoviolacea DSM 6061]KZN49660.1 hypothetical protein N474_05250 [Pseudoalteromonas luteoviolacea CPMOR-2]MBE0386942.1 hypothetical protein [Pseudoalteromonas luteoviolacea DSM 6061]
MKDNQEMKPLTLEDLDAITGGVTSKVNQEELANEPVLIRGCCTQGCCDQEFK